MAGVFSSAILLSKIECQPVSTPLDIMTFNVGTHTGKPADIDRIARIIGRQGAPDILVLQEVHGDASCRYLSEKLGLPYRVFSFYPTGMDDGLAVISRYPVTILKTFTSIRYGAIAVEAEVGQNQFLICPVHLKRIPGIKISETGINPDMFHAMQILYREIFQENFRTHAVAELSSWAASQAYDYVIIAGDFNTIPVSKFIRKLTSRYPDSLWPKPDYLTGTYNHLTWPVTPRIDYIFHSPNLTCSQAVVIRESAGDHYPVRAILGRMTDE